jgi:hypothetical protein
VFLPKKEDSPVTEGVPLDDMGTGGYSWPVSSCHRGFMLCVSMFSYFLCSFSFESELLDFL